MTSEVDVQPAPQADPAEERIGQVLAEKYALRRVIGRGGMGVVYAAIHQWTSREVAVKMLHRELARDPSVIKRFLQEARSAAKLHHPHVVDVLDMGQHEDGSVYLVLELLKGTTLDRRVDDAAPLPVDETVEYLLPVMEALAVAHTHGIVHRDLKPENIFLSVDPRNRVVPKLLDFGIAKVLHAPASGATKTGAIVGTPAYMSPEQIRAGTEVGPTSDVWSMGVVFRECVTGKLPFDADTSTALLAAVLTDEVRPLREVAPELPEAVCTVIDKAMARSPDDRYETMGDFADALEMAVEASSIQLGQRVSRIDYDPSKAEVITHGTATPITIQKLLTFESGPGRFWLLAGAAAAFMMVCATAAFIAFLYAPRNDAGAAASEAIDATGTAAPATVSAPAEDLAHPSKEEALADAPKPVAAPTEAEELPPADEPVVREDTARRRPASRRQRPATAAPAPAPTEAPSTTTPPEGRRPTSPSVGEVEEDLMVPENWQ